jgi:hypothetical protein
MPYVALTDLYGKIPAPFLIQALDDDQSGVANQATFDLIASQVALDIEARLGQRYATPFVATPGQPIPQIVLHAALIFACEGVYARRVAIDANPWTGMANSLRTKLDRIGQGLEPLTPTVQRQDPSVTAIQEWSKTHSRRTSI